MNMFNFPPCCLNTKLPTLAKNLPDDFFILTTHARMPFFLSLYKPLNPRTMHVDLIATKRLKEFFPTPSRNGLGVAKGILVLVGKTKRDFHWSCSTNFTKIFVTLCWIDSPVLEEHCLSNGETPL